MKKRFLSAVLAVILCVSLASPAFAAEIGHEGAVRQMAARETESETERIMEIVYDQLSEQDALSLLPAFESIVTSMVAADVNQKYGIAPTALETYSYELPNGGAIGYEGPFQTTCVSTYLTDEQYNEIYNDEQYWEGESNNELLILGANTVFAILTQKPAFAVLGGWGIVFTALASGIAYANDKARADVAEADGYAIVLYVSAMGGAEQGTSVFGWHSHETATISAASSDIHIEESA